MKQVFFFILFSSLAISTQAQNVGIGTTTPASTSLLHINVDTSTAKGLIVTETYNP